MQYLLQRECLLKAGYDARNLTVTWGLNDGHTVTVLKQDNSFWNVMDSSVLNIQGPYKSYDEIANDIVSRLAVQAKTITNIFIENNDELMNRNKYAFNVFEP